MSRADPAGAGQVAPFAALSASYFAHIGFFNPYLPLWLQHLGFPILVISLLASVQSLTRVFAPYVWGVLSDRTGERVRLLRWSALVALVSSLGLWYDGGPAWIAVILLLLFTHTGSMMSLTEAAMAHLVAGDWGRYGRIRLWGSVGFMVTVFLAGAWFEHFGMGHFPAWTLLSLAAVLAGTLWLPDVRDPPASAREAGEPIGPTLRQPSVRWFFASLYFHVTMHFAIYTYFSLYLDGKGYGKAAIGALWAVSVVVEIAWFFLQGRLMRFVRMSRWLLVCSGATALRMALVGGAADWVVALVLVVAVRVGVGTIRQVPEGAQNFWEWLVEGLYDFLGGIIGPDLVRKTFWFFSALFLFVVTTNWFGLLPGVGTIGWGHPGDHGFHVSEPLLRGANADFNMTFAMSLVFFVLWTVWALQANGPVGFLKHLFGDQREIGLPMWLLLSFIFLAVGGIEVVSILFRPVSLSFRLYGNVFAGENMLESMTHLGGATWGWLTALPFYFMELLVGLVQALVFMLLTAVFTLLICSHDEEHGEDGSHH